jgi:hypothetical protein
MPKDAAILPLHARSDIQQYQVAKAWMGDAILAYHVRWFVLNDVGWDGELFSSVTRNSTLKDFGRENNFLTPSEVEAHIFDLHYEDPQKAKEFCETLYRWVLKKQGKEFLPLNEFSKALERTKDQNEKNESRESRGY